MENNNQEQSLPVNLVPTPTIAYREDRKFRKVTLANGQPLNKAIAFSPNFNGPRVLVYKQDPSVNEIGVRKTFLPNFVSAGPSDSRIKSAGLAPVTANAFGDFIQTPGTESFDAVQAFTVVRMTLNMVERALGGAALPWQWNSATNTEPLSVYAHGLPDTMNAFYQRSGKCLKFGDFIMPGSNPAVRVYTCRSLDIVAHETGHAVLDSLKPNWLGVGGPPQTGGLHESFGDLTAIFLTLSQFDQVEAVIAQTKANLHDKTFLSDLAEQFGLALGRTNGLRNADNNLKLSEAGTEVHAISQVFTGGIYDVLADIFAFERNTALRDDAKTLYDVAQYVYGLLLKAIHAAPATAATFADVVNQMVKITVADGKPVQYRNAIRNQFTLRQVVVSPTPLNVDFTKVVELKADVKDQVGAFQDRSTCCGTMKLHEYLGEGDFLENEMKNLKKVFAQKGKLTQVSEAAHISN